MVLGGLRFQHTNLRGTQFIHKPGGKGIEGVGAGMMATGIVQGKSDGRMGEHLQWRWEESKGFLRFVGTSEMGCKNV